MVSENGWIKLHSKIRDSSFYKNSKLVHLWIELLLRASWRETKTIISGRERVLQPGQLCTGLDQLSDSTGIARSTIRRGLEFFQSTGQVEQEITNKCRIITITKWSDYQHSETQTELRWNSDGTQMELKRNSNGTQMEAIKEDLKILRNKDLIPPYSPPLGDGPEKVKKLKPKREPISLDAVSYPDGFDRNDVRIALGEWLEFKKTKNPYKNVISVNKLLKQWVDRGPDRMIRAIDFSIAQNYQGIYEQGGMTQSFTPFTAKKTEAPRPTPPPFKPTPPMAPPTEAEKKSVRAMIEKTFPNLKRGSEPLPDAGHPPKNDGNQDPLADF